MRNLSAFDIVRICEWGRDKHALDRALMLLRAATDDSDHETLRRLPIGRRDSLLLALRERTYGPKLDLVVRCPQCAEPIEFSTTVAAITVPAAGDAAGGAVALDGYTLALDGYEVEFRLADSLDLAAVAEVRDAGEARDRLLARCVSGARAGGEPIAFAALPPSVRSALAARLAALDPQADVSFRLACPVCALEWRTLFDPLGFFWSELEAHAKQLLVEVAGIAKVYGWEEATILRISAERRATYLELAVGG